MISVVQRVLEASVSVDGRVIGRIGPGLVALTSIHRTDTDEQIAWTVNKLTSLRIFPSADGTKGFDRDVREIGGAVLLISNFTVAAATQKGRRPSFDAAADPATGRVLFDRLLTALRATGVPTETGEFGADMKVHILNDGPITLIVESP